MAFKQLVREGLLKKGAKVGFVFLDKLGIPVFGEQFIGDFGSCTFQLPLNLLASLSYLVFVLNQCRQLLRKLPINQMPKKSDPFRQGRFRLAVPYQLG